MRNLRSLYKDLEKVTGKKQRRKYHFGLEIKEEEEGEECSICYKLLSDHSNGEKVTIPCGNNHTFHKECICKWFNAGNIAEINCPLCRGSITEGYVRKICGTYAMDALGIRNKNVPNEFAEITSHPITIPDRLDELDRTNTTNTTNRRNPSFQIDEGATEIEKTRALRQKKMGSYIGTGLLIGGSYLTRKLYKKRKAAEKRRKTRRRRRRS